MMGYAKSPKIHICTCYTYQSWVHSHGNFPACWHLSLAIFGPSARLKWKCSQADHGMLTMGILIPSDYASRTSHLSYFWFQMKLFSKEHWCCFITAWEHFGWNPQIMKLVLRFQVILVVYIVERPLNSATCPNSLISLSKLVVRSSNKNSSYFVCFLKHLLVHKSCTGDTLWCLLMCLQFILVRFTPPPFSLCHFPP
jgi:hypothetical protein